MKSGIPYVPTPLARDGRLYLLCDNGQIRCVRTATGELIWEDRLPERFYSSVVGGNNKLYLTSKSGDVFVLAMGDKYELLARNPLGGPTFATPAIANGTLFFRTETHLLAIRAGK
jgi:outer membrane protein assembly factor BamB